MAYQLDLDHCNLFFYDKISQNCWLATFGADLTIIGAQTGPMAGFADLGNARNVPNIKYNIFYQSFYLYVHIKRGGGSKIE